MNTNLTEKLARIDRAKSEVDAFRPVSPEQEARIFQKFRLDWNYHSNAIEGNKLTIGETEAFLSEGLTADGKPFKDHLDIRGHNEVIDFLKSFVQKKEELTEAVIRQMHSIMLVEPYYVEARTSDNRIVRKLIEIGQYKTEPNEVTTVTGAVHTYVLPQDTPDRMAKLITFYRNNIEIDHPVTLAAAFHHEFVAIHPFADGNGRMARILMNLILMRAGFPPAVIKTSERDRYVSGLVNADHGDLFPFFEFIADKVLDSLDLYLKGIRGESLEEDDDFDKQMALFKTQLAAEPDPIVYSENAYAESLAQSISPLLNKLVSKLNKFDDLFVENHATVFVHGMGTQIQNYAANVDAILQRFKKVDTRHPVSGHIQFEWRYFKKAGGTPFTYSIKMEVAFSQFNYSVTIQKEKIEKPYSQVVQKDEINRLANKAAGDFLLTIQELHAKETSTKTENRKGIVQ